MAKKESKFERPEIVESKLLCTSQNCSVLTVIVLDLEQSRISACQNVYQLYFSLFARTLST